MWISGEVQVSEGTFMTPYHVGKLMKEVGEELQAPSTGAVYNVFQKWEDIGYAVFRKEPYAFVDFSPLGRELGLEGYKRARADGFRQRHAEHLSRTGQQP